MGLQRSFLWLLFTLKFCKTIILFSVINISALHNSTVHWHLLLSFHILSSCCSDLLAIHALLVLPFQFGLFYFITVLFWLDSSTVFIKHPVKPLSQMTQLKKLSFITVHWQRIKLKKFLFKDLKDFFLLLSEIFLSFTVFLLQFYNLQFVSKYAASFCDFLVINYLYLQTGF